jgi:hypothetical protein
LWVFLTRGGHPRTGKLGQDRQERTVKKDSYERIGQSGHLLKKIINTIKGFGKPLQCLLPGAI